MAMRPQSLGVGEVRNRSAVEMGWDDVTFYVVLDCVVWCGRVLKFSRVDIHISSAVSINTTCTRLHTSEFGAVNVLTLSSIDFFQRQSCCPCSVLQQSLTRVPRKSCF